jgi:dTDP-4-dehydrorhamnose 3,5-epimerase
MLAGMGDELPSPAGSKLEAVASAALRDLPSVDDQSEELPPTIDGVEVKRLAIHADMRGTLVPAIDVRDSFWDEPIVYAYRIGILPGRIKGWGMHRLQTDRYLMTSGCVRVVLFDGREGSSTAGALVELNFTESTPGLVKIPPGVWHADQNWGESEAVIVNFPTRPYDPANPDKYRLDPHGGAIPFDWSAKDG